MVSSIPTTWAPVAAAAGGDGEHAAEQALFAELAALLRERHPRARALPDLRLDVRLDRDLGLDSLTRMELLARLEQRFRVRIPEQAGFVAETPGDLLRVLAGAAPIAAAPSAEVLALARGERLALPTTAQTLVDVLHWHAQRHPDRLHVHFEGGEADGRDLTFGTLHATALRVAAGLQAHGLRPGEPVALMLSTHPDLLVGFFGAMLGGGVPVPLYPPGRPGEMAEYWRRQAGILHNCQARLLLGDATLRAHRRLVRAFTGIEHLLVVDELAHATAGAEPVPVAASDLALLQYTSGSTADPKGVMLTHANVLASLRTMGTFVGVDSADTFVSWLPLYHDMGLIGAWIGCLYFGAPLVLMPPQSFLLRPERWLWAIHRYRATLTAAPNFAFELCAHRIPDAALEGLDLGSLRLAFYGAEPVFPETLERFAARFARHGFRREALSPVYGLAENTLGLTFPPPGRAPRVLHIERDRFLADGCAVPCAPEAGIATLAFVSCGLPLPGHELRIADDDDRELPPGRQGHVQFRGPAACTAYHRNPEATRALRHGDWLDSGDLGFLHEGELYLSGRVKDLIIRAGRHLHPQALEQAVGELPGVRRGRVAVFGTVAPQTGTERLVVVAETRLADAEERKALRARIQAAVAAQAGEPADEVVLAVPGAVLKTSSGKLRRVACREAFERGELGKGGAPRLLGVLLRGLRADLRNRLRRLRAWLFVAWAWSAFALLVPAALVAALLPGLRLRWAVERGLLELLRLLTAIPLTVKVQAAPPRRPCIFVANHASYLDSLLLVRTLPRPAAFVAKEELARRPLLRWLLRRFGAVFVARFDPARCTEVLAEARRGDRDFVFFPEGTFRRMPGLLSFHLGAFAVAAEAGMPVVPVALRGTRAVLCGDDWLPRHGPLAVTIGPAILPLSGADRWSETLRLAEAARTFLRAECGEPDLEDAVSPLLS
ncbi:AMP-binding protein [Vulcaniibacterium gelatinicum]|uniref:AMP-binding protein n=1 Tax=Vulcaniibacterium gelatinicum TaxID=2598725 RepID=UPI0011CA7E11|nr:AMP-binding protein [Vulcaniibacterium gelatinicum]